MKLFLAVNENDGKGLSPKTSTKIYALLCMSKALRCFKLKSQLLAHGKRLPPPRCTVSTLLHRTDPLHSLKGLPAAAE